jgi:hypothetical protein
MRALLSALLFVLLGASAARGYLLDVRVLPEQPVSTEPVTVSVWGAFTTHDELLGHAVAISGLEIELHVYESLPDPHPGIDPPDIYALTADLGVLPAGTYQLRVCQLYGAPIGAPEAGSADQQVELDDPCTIMDAPGHGGHLRAVTFTVVPAATGGVSWSALKVWYR